jgi:hypothetical protein
MDVRSTAKSQLTRLGNHLIPERRLPRPITPREYYLAMYTLLGRPALPGDLARAELKVSSQNGEDGVLQEIFRRVGLPDEPYFIEFGTESGSETNSALLADVLGWRGLLIEGDPGFYGRLERKYRRNPRITTIEAFVTRDNVEDLFGRAGSPVEPDLLSIDIDGDDYWVWQAVESYRPRVVVCEYNASLDGHTMQPPDAGPWDGTAYFGASIDALRELGEGKGYRLVHTDICGVNAFFVRHDQGGDWSDAVVRGPNYYLRAEAHPPDPLKRAYMARLTG